MKVKNIMETKTFKELGLNERILLALRDKGYVAPTPIQEKTIPLILRGRDVIGCAQTGTGKTAAFALPIIHLLSGKRRSASRRGARCLVLTPTRELAAQISEGFRIYGKGARLKQALVFGGVGQRPQINSLSHGVDVLVATPGRLLDLMGQGYVHFEDVDFFVLDEADRMLDMGFIRDVERIIKKLPLERQSLLFSATMSRKVIRLARGILCDPAEVSVTPSSTTVELVDQQVYFVDREKKFELLKNIVRGENVDKTLVFARTKRGADRIAKRLNSAQVPADAIHGNKSQAARTNALARFRSGESRVVIATDLAARGIDVSGITHVINYELPNEPETYVHRIGRTGRAGASGVAVSFCDLDETLYLHDIEKLTSKNIPVVEGHSLHSEKAHAAKREFEAGRTPKGVNPPHKRSGGGRVRGGSSGKKRGSTTPKGRYGSFSRRRRR